MVHGGLSPLEEQGEATGTQKPCQMAGYYRSLTQARLTRPHSHGSAEASKNRTFSPQLAPYAGQVRRGMAWVYDRYVTDRSLYRLQDAAKAVGVGLWGDPAPIPPSDYRRAKPKN